MRIGVSGRGLVVCALLSGFGALAFSGSAWAQEAKPAAAAEVKPAATEVKPAEGGTKKPEEANMNFITIVTRAGWFGVLIWISLIACSMVMVALVTDCYLTIQEKKLAPNRLVEDVRNSLAQGDLLKALQHCENTPVPLSRILKAGFSNAEEGFEVVQDAVGVAAEIFARIFHPVRRIADVRQRLADVEIAPVVRDVFVAGQVDEQIAQILIGAHRVVIAGGIFVAGPQAVLVQHDALARRAAGDQPAEAAVADGERLVDEGGRLAAAQA